MDALRGLSSAAVAAARAAISDAADGPAVPPLLEGSLLPRPAAMLESTGAGDVCVVPKGSYPVLLFEVTLSKGACNLPLVRHVCSAEQTAFHSSADLWKGTLSCRG